MKTQFLVEEQIKLSILICIYLVQHWFLYDSSYHNVSKSMAFVFGIVQKHFDSTHLFRHSNISYWSLQNFITFLSIQVLAKSIRCDQSFLLRYTWVFSLVMRITRPQYIDILWSGHQVRALRSSIYYSWMLPEWTTVGH